MSKFIDLLRKRKIKKEQILDMGIENLPDLESLSPDERSVLFKILDEYSEQGSSDTLLDLWKQDYDEIPVDIEKFVCDPHYLGKATNGGRAIWPFWMDALETIFDPRNTYFEVIFSGAIGIGKTTIADIGVAYQLYKLLCLKSPQSHYSLAPGSKIYIAFFNITLELSKGVAFTKLQDMLQASPWFLTKGRMVGQKHLVYDPGKNIEFRIGSTEKHGLGADIFCLFKGTEIVTTEGIQKVENLVDKDLFVYSYDNGTVTISDKCSVRESGYAYEVMEIEFENGVTVKCTPSHRWLVRDEIAGVEKYLTAQELKSGDDIVSLSGGGFSEKSYAL